MKENGVENRNGSAKSILHPRIALFLLCFSNSTVKDQLRCPGEVLKDADKKGYLLWQVASLLNFGVPNRI